MNDESKVRPPRGALIVIAIGLLATAVAALLSTDKLLSVATLEWVEEAELPDSRKVAIPGGGQMQLTNADVRATEENAGEFTLFRTAALLTIDRGSAIGQGRLRCAISVPKRTIVAKSPESSRASFPRSSEELSDQGTPENALIEFSSHSTDLALIEMSDVVGKHYTQAKGIVVEWPPFRIGQQVWQFGFPAGRPKDDLSLPFASIWRTTTIPAAKIACTVETAAGNATVRTAGAL